MSRGETVRVTSTDVVTHDLRAGPRSNPVESKRKEPEGEADRGVAPPGALPVDRRFPIADVGLFWVGVMQRAVAAQTRPIASNFAPGNGNASPVAQFVMVTFASQMSFE